MRTTLDIETPILREVKKLAKRDGRSIGSVVSGLLAEALSRNESTDPAPGFRWISRNLEPKVDLDDKDAVLDAMDGVERFAVREKRKK